MQKRLQKLLGITTHPNLPRSMSMSLFHHVGKSVGLLRVDVCHRPTPEETIGFALDLGSDF